MIGGGVAIPAAMSAPDGMTAVAADALSEVRKVAPHTARVMSPANGSRAAPNAATEANRPAGSRLIDRRMAASRASGICGRNARGRGNSPEPIACRME